jgi:heptaprenyl diphosphate synthase
MLLVVFTRVIAGSFLTGSLFTPSFILGLSGGIVSALAMAGAASLGSRVFSVIGISLIGSVAHVVTQLVVVMLLFVQNESLVFLLPLLLTSACAGGLIVGWLSSRMIEVMKAEQGFLPGQTLPAPLHDHFVVATVFGILAKCSGSSRSATRCC